MHTRARPFGAHKHDTVIQWSTGDAPETVRDLALCLYFLRHLQISVTVRPPPPQTCAATGVPDMYVGGHLMLFLLFQQRVLSHLIHTHPDQGKDYKQHANVPSTFVPTPVARARTCEWPAAECLKVRRVGDGPGWDHLLEGPTSFSPTGRPAARWPATPCHYLVGVRLAKQVN